MPWKRILLTGITGNLGAMAALRFLAEGHAVYAPVRSRSTSRMIRKRAVDSLRALVAPAALDEAAVANLVVLDADVTDANALGALAAPEEVDETWHFASSLKYMPKDRDEIFEANLGGTRNVLEFHRARQRRGARMFYVGTAYLAGRGVPVVPETRMPFSEDMAFNNEYEKSKLLAENLFLDAVDAGEVDGAVFRPSIVVGRPGTGRLVNYNGYYLGVKAWMALSDYVAGRGQRGERVRVWLEPESTVNLIPLDTVVEVMGRLADAGAGRGAVFNVVNAAEVTLAEVFEVLGRYLAVEPVLCGAAAGGESKTTYEKLVAYSLTYTAPYMKQRVAFRTDNVRAAIGCAPRVPLYPDELDRLTRHYVTRFESAGAALAGGVT
jgi:nucleoside-diphosphate-sugar epimerase